MILDGVPDPNSITYTLWQIGLWGGSSGVIDRSVQSDGFVRREEEGEGGVPRVSLGMVLHY